MFGNKVSYAVGTGLLVITSAVVAFAGATQFRFTGPAEYGVYVANIETGKIRHLASFYNWSISPDGKWIAGSIEGDARHPPRGPVDSFQDISVVSVATGKKTFLRRYQAWGPGCGPELTWSGDSQWLRVTADWNTDDNIDREQVDVLAVQPKARTGPKPPAAKVNVAAPYRKATSLRMKGYTVDEAVYSPDRRKVAAICTHGFYQKAGYDAGIFLCHPDGSNRVRVTRFVFKTRAANYDWRSDSQDREVIWLPNGKAIAFRRTSHEAEEI